MAEDKKDKKESKKEEKAVDYTVWHPDHRLNHIYMTEDGQKIVWTMKSGSEEPTLKIVN